MKPSSTSAQQGVVGPSDTHLPPAGPGSTEHVAWREGVVGEEQELQEGAHPLVLTRTSLPA